MARAARRLCRAERMMDRAVKRESLHGQIGRESTHRDRVRSSPSLLRRRGTPRDRATIHDVRRFCDDVPSRFQEAPSDKW